jgi:hypothetical protein
MSYAKLYKWGRLLLFLGLAAMMPGYLFIIRHWPYGRELLLVGQIVAGAGLIILLIKVLRK